MIRNNDHYPLISIFILNWNRLDDTKEAIESAFNQTYPNLEVIVVDNGSNEDNTFLLPTIFPKIKFVQLDKNYGCPGGRNRGIDFCSGDFIFYLDNDGILDQDAVLNAFKLFEENKDLGIVTGKIIFFKNKSEIRTKIDHKIVTKKSSLFSGGVSMHKKEIYGEIGKFPDDFMYGGEETNFSLKLLTINKYIMYSENVVLWHKFSDLARDNRFNYISRYSNKLVTYYELMPFFERFKFTLWYLIVYSFVCLKKGYLIAFLKSMPSTFKRANYARSKSSIRLSPGQLKIYKSNQY